jgi:hypothetical protein
MLRLYEGRKELGRVLQKSNTCMVMLKLLALSSLKFSIAYTYTEHTNI